MDEKNNVTQPAENVPENTEQGPLESNDGKSRVLEFPLKENNPQTPQPSEDTADEQGDIITDPENPINEMNAKQLGQMIKNVAEMVRVMESIWNSTKKDFDLKDEHMRQLYAYNDQHRTSMPEGLSDEEREKWDHFNGLDGISDEELVEIFGEGHKIIGIDHSQTMDRVKSSVNDFFNYLTCMKEYRQIHDAYLQLVDTQEENEIEKLKEVMEAEEDPEKKEKMKESIDLYYERKYLDFLRQPLDPRDINRISRAWHTERTIEYYVKRARDKLKQLKISSMFIPEISKFEIRFLPEKYHKLSNIFLVYFMSLIIYTDCYDAKSEARNKAIAIVIALDSYIRGAMREEVKQRINENMMLFLDQFMDLIEDPKPTEETAGE